MGKFYAYQSILTTDCTNLCLTDTDAKRGEIGNPKKVREDHTCQWDECFVASMCAMGG